MSPQTHFQNFPATEDHYKIAKYISILGTFLFPSACKMSFPNIQVFSAQEQIFKLFKNHFVQEENFYIVSSSFFFYMKFGLISDLHKLYSFTAYKSSTDSHHHKRKCLWLKKNTQAGDLCITCQLPMVRINTVHTRRFLGSYYNHYILLQNCRCCCCIATATEGVKKLGMGEGTHMIQRAWAGMKSGPEKKFQFFLVLPPTILAVHLLKFP